MTDTALQSLLDDLLSSEDETEEPPRRAHRASHVHFDGAKGEDGHAAATQGLPADFGVASVFDTEPQLEGAAARPPTQAHLADEDRRLITAQQRSRRDALYEQPSPPVNRLDAASCKAATLSSEAGMQPGGQQAASLAIESGNGHMLEAGIQQPAKSSPLNDAEDQHLDFDQLSTASQDLADPPELTSQALNEGQQLPPRLEASTSPGDIAVQPLQELAFRTSVELEAQLPLPRHISDLEEAEAAERDLASGKGACAALDERDGPANPIDSLRLRLQFSREDWSAGGQPDGRGGMMGGQLLVRADLVGAVENALAKHPESGQARAAAMFRGALAVGMSSGVCLVLLPRGKAGQPELVVLGQPKPHEEAAVTCLEFSTQGTLLLAGHADGDVNFWELRRTGWECVKTIKEVHAHPVVQAAFLEGPIMTAVTADSRGRLVHHNVTAYLSLTAIFAGRLTKAAQPTVLTDGRQLGALCFVTGLTTSRPADSGRPAGHDPASQHVLEGKLLICSAKGAYVGRVAQDGKLGILHTIARPTEARPGCMPYAAWRFLPLDSTARYAEIHLVMAWEHDLHLLAVPIPVPKAESDGAPQEKPPVRFLNGWKVNLPVVALHWMDGPSIGAVIQAGAHARLLIFSALGELQRDMLELGDPVRGTSDIAGANAAPELCYHAASAASQVGLLLLCSQGVRLARFMSWQERLGGLRELRQYELGLLVALHIFEIASMPPTSASQAWKAEGRGADLAQVAEALAKLLSDYVALALSGSDGSVAQIRAATAAKVAIEACIAIDKRSLLWSAVFPQFQAAEMSAAFLARLLPFILLDQLTTLAPEVMQALVEFCAADGSPEAVEAAVMHMDIASLDLNQIIRLCRQHHLYSALAFLFPRALLDFMAPAAELIVAIAYAVDGSSSPSAKVLALKLLVYLRLCFQGLSFPPGSGMLDEARVVDTKAQLLGLLLYGTPRFVGRILEAFGADESVGPAAALDELLPGPHPVLACLVSIAPGATMTVLREALVSCSLTQAALLSAVQQPDRSSAGEALAEQAILDGVVSLLNAGVFRREEGHSAELSNGNDSMLHAIEFISDTVAIGRVTAAPAVILKLLEWLVAGPWRGNIPPPREEREAQFMALLQHLDLREDVHMAEAGSTIAESARSLAQQAGFLRAEAQTQHVSGHESAALQCFLQISAAAAFEFLEAALASPHAEEGRRREIWGAVRGMLRGLVEADSKALARIVLVDFPAEHAGIVAGLADSPELQFRYLRGAVRAAESISRRESSRQESDLGLLAIRPAGAAGMQAAAQAAEQYLCLLCQFEPTAVLPFLQSNESYRVQEVLPSCQQYGVLDAQAFLLERLGDVEAALDIHVQQLAAAVDALVKLVLSGQIRASQLARSGQVRTYSQLLGQKRSSRIRDELLLGDLSATAALKAAVSLCQRQSRDAPPDVAERLWLRIIRVFAGQLRQLRSSHPLQPLDEQRSKQLQSAQSARRELAWPLPGGSTDHLRSLREAAAIQRQQEEQGESEERPWQACQRLLMRHLEDIIADMAGFVPLAAIGERILDEFAADSFGDFRGSLTSLLAAYNYELSILQAANRLMSADAFRILFANYRSHTSAPNIDARRLPVPAGELLAISPSSASMPHGSRPHSGAAEVDEAIALHGVNTWTSMLANEPSHGSSSPIRRSGCDINFLKAHGLHSMTDGSWASGTVEPSFSVYD